MNQVSGPQILVQLHGGLGNQMFQAAAGLALARRLGGELAFDLSRFRDKGLRAFALSALPIGSTPIVAKAPKLMSRLGAKARKLVGGDGIKRPAGWRGSVHVERGFHFDPAIGTLVGNTMLAGFFQSPRYFSGSEEIIRQVFDASGAVSDEVARRGERLRNIECIAVHLRRGDYATGGRTALVHPVLEDAYYGRALAILRKMSPAAEILVFSDEPGVATEKARAWGGVAVAGASAIEDLWLMSRCRHHVIANSSFSWWSAWLDDRADGLTIAPRQWFSREKQLMTYVGDLFPVGWVLL